MRNTIWVLLASLTMSLIFADQTPAEDQQTQTQQAEIEVGKARPPACCWDQGYEVPCGCMHEGYNYPAQIHTQMWDAYISASFLYWEARQDGMSLALSGTSPTKVIYQDFEYKPGVKAEAGFASESWDDWGGLVEYTRFHGTYRNNEILTNGTIEGFTADDFESRWKNELDVIDFGLFRNYYVGRRLTLMTYFGGRGGWIDQSLNFNVNLQSPPVGVTNPIIVQYESDSWFVGPRAALRTNWLLGGGFSLVGNTSGSICYQKYDVDILQEDIANPGQNLTTVLNVGQLRPYFDLQMGFRWGWYTCDQRFHFDLQATYDFMIYFNQNMIRMLADLSSTGNEKTPGNLYFQGLTLRGMFSF